MHHCGGGGLSVVVLRSSLHPSALWSGACGQSTLSPVAGGSSGPAGLSLNVGALGMGVSVGVSLPGLSQLTSLPALPLPQLAPSSPDELSPAPPPGPPSPSAASMPLSLTHHPSSLLPYVDDLDFLGEYIRHFYRYVYMIYPIRGSMLKCFNYFSYHLSKPPSPSNNVGDRKDNTID